MWRCACAKVAAIATTIPAAPMRLPSGAVAGDERNFSARMNAMIVAGSAHPDGLTRVIGFVAMVLAAANVVGGFVVTDRMLEMFKKRERPRQNAAQDSPDANVGDRSNE